MKGCGIGLPGVALVEALITKGRAEVQPNSASGRVAQVEKASLVAALQNGAVETDKEKAAFVVFEAPVTQVAEKIEPSSFSSRVENRSKKGVKKAQGLVDFKATGKIIPTTGAAKLASLAEGVEHFRLLIAEAVVSPVEEVRDLRAGTAASASSPIGEAAISRRFIFFSRKRKSREKGHGEAFVGRLTVKERKKRLEKRRIEAKKI